MLLLEALLRTDLLSPDFVATTCGHQLMRLYTNSSTDNRVRQKARKVSIFISSMVLTSKSINKQGSEHLAGK